jgi:hypothetical protein
MDNRHFQAAAAASPPPSEAAPSIGYPTDGNPATATPATIPGAAWFHQIGEELRAVIVASGLAPDPENLNQLAAAIQSGAFKAAANEGTSDALEADYVPPVLTLIHGMTLYLRASAANATAAPTFAPNGLTPKTIVKGNNKALAIGDIAGAGHWLQLQYDAILGKWVLQNPYASTIGDATTEGKGIVELATDAEAQALTDSARVLAPATLVAAFQGGNQYLGADGYQKFPGGLILQWGRLTGLGPATSGTILFPISFAHQVFGVFFSDRNTGTAGIDFAVGYDSFDLVSAIYSKPAFRSEFCWLALGY